MSDLIHVAVTDLRYAARQLRRNPSLSIAAVLCFALGIGANTSIFSVVDAVLFRPLPFPNADRLVLVGESLPRFGQENFGVISAPEYADYRRLDGHAFDASAIFETGSFGISGGGDPERVVGLHASASIFNVLGVPATLGRGFAPDDDLVGSRDVVVLSDALWRRRYAADPAIVGRSIDVDGKPVVVAGVMPRSFRFPLAGMGGMGGEPADIFVPYRITADVERQRANSYRTSLIARLRPGVTLAAARSSVAGVAAQLPAVHPDTYRGGWVTLADVFPLRDHAVSDVRTPLLLLLSAVGLVLLIACINVSSLLLARAAARRHEIAVRQALGASRARLMQQFLAESAVLVTAGGVVGIAIAAAGVRLIARHAPRAMVQGYDVSLDGRVLIVTAAITAITAVAVSLAPGLHQSGASVTGALRDSGRTATDGAARQRGRRMLVVAQFALAIMLAAGAGLMVRSLLRARAVDPGFNPDRVLTFRLLLPEFRYATSARVSQFERGFVERLRAIPGAAIASATSHLPMTGASRIAFAIDGATFTTHPIASGELVLPDYFSAMEIPLRAGRYLDAGDVAQSAPVAVINQTLARTYFPGANAVGKRLKWGSTRSPDPWATIVGVTADVHTDGLDQVELPAIYFPIAQHDTGPATAIVRGLTYVIRSGGDPGALTNAVRRAVREADPELPIIALAPMTDVVSVSVAGRQFNTVLLGAFSVLALALASVGIYGLMAFAVVQRTREIGIRLAVGATPADVLRLVVSQGARVAGVGVAIGVVGALLLTRLMRTLLFDVSPLDPITFIGAPIVLLGVAALASYVPARRAAKIDAQTAIRAD